MTQLGQLLHGGWGYAEEYPRSSRYVADAQVLPIFEGVKPILTLKVIARQLLAGSGDGGVPTGLGPSPCRACRARPAADPRSQAAPQEIAADRLKPKRDVGLSWSYGEPAGSEPLKASTLAQAARD